MLANPEAVRAAILAECGALSLRSVDIAREDNPDPDVECSVAEYLDANPDDETPYTLLRAILSGEPRTIGGGAAAEYSITVSADSETIRRLRHRLNP